MVQFEGMSHNPVFTYQVNIGDMNAIGTGNSKKQAKHSAASKCQIDVCLVFQRTENLGKLKFVTRRERFNASFLLAFSDYFKPDIY